MQQIICLNTQKVNGYHRNTERVSTGIHICYADGKTLLLEYTKHEYCTWGEKDAAQTVKWNLKEVTADIFDDLEGAVNLKLQGPR